MTEFSDIASAGRDMAALVLFSGGQDSTTCLGWALERFGRVETVGVDYGQRHQAELVCRGKVLEKMRAMKPSWAERLGEDHMLSLPVLGEVADCALTDERRIAFESSGLPNTFVPGRNLLFFTLAAAIAYRRGARVLVGGMCETDYSGYPDCRDNTLKSLQVTLSLGLDAPIILEPPLMRLTKAETWELAERTGGDEFVKLVRDETHTCYMGDHEHHHAWGWGCGECPACRLREKGWEEWSGSKRF